MPSGFRKSAGKLQVLSIAKNPVSANDGPSLKKTVTVQKELAMNRLIFTAGWKAVIAGILFLGVSAVGIRAQETNCQSSMLKGDYAFTVSGQIFTSVKAMDGTVTTLVVQRDGIAMTHFDGEGHLSQVDFVLSSPNVPVPVPPPPAPPTDPVTGFHDMEMGTYTVFTDCTGTFTIDSPKTSPVVVVKFALSDGGRSIHAIVTSLTLPGATAPTPALIHSEGHRLGRIVEWWE
jgi:hypothetical protein